MRILSLFKATIHVIPISMVGEMNKDTEYFSPQIVIPIIVQDLCKVQLFLMYSDLVANNPLVP